MTGNGDQGAGGPPADRRRAAATTGSAAGAPTDVRQAPRPKWEFGYAPLCAGAPSEARATRELIVATAEPTDGGRIAAAVGGGARAELALARQPLYWTRLTLAHPALSQDVSRLLSRQGIETRYVAATNQPSFTVGSAFGEAPSVERASGWQVRKAIGRSLSLADTPGTWFLRDEAGGIDVDRARFGNGAGTRLAVIDDDALEADALELDRRMSWWPRETPAPHRPWRTDGGMGSRVPSFLGVAPEGVTAALPDPEGRREFGSSSPRHRDRRSRRGRRRCMRHLCRGNDESDAG